MQELTEWLVGIVPALQLDVLGRLLLALGLGAAVGLERELSGKPAGLRTIILICVGAELLTEMSIAIGGFVVSDLVRPDPARIAAQIVSGIGFIGAGTILVHRGSVVGLTTAATLWVAAAIGITVGARAYVPAVGATVLVLLTLAALGWLERRVLKDRIENILHVTVTGPKRDGAELQAWLSEAGFRVRRVDVARGEDETTYGFRIAGRSVERERLMERLAADEDVRGARLE